MNSKLAVSVGAWTVGGAEAARTLSPGYRADIDGLRAFAVSAVLLFHFFPQVVPGGYTGVDVFFVISGFVVTQSILLDAAQGEFRLKTFYMRRIRRLYPSLLLVTSFCILFSWFTDLAFKYREISEEVFLALAYLINLHFARGPGYFDTNAVPSPLLHLWSLAVEEQFYLFWPTLALISLRLKNPLKLPIALACVSFLAHILVEMRHPEVAFYVLPTRAWQFMVGAGIALGRDLSLLPGDRRVALLSPSPSFLSTGSMIALLVVCFAYRPDGSYTAGMALVPTAATGVLVCFPGSYLSEKIFSRPILAWIGQRSYALYIWHWPILVAIKQYTGEFPDIRYLLAALGLTFVSAHLTYTYVELPIRLRSSSRLPRVASALLVAQCVLMIFGFLSWKGAIPERRVELRSFSAAHEDWVDLDKLTLLNGRKHGRILFFGDSYVAQLYPRLLKVSQDNKGNHKEIVLLTSPGCAPFLMINRRSNRLCLPFAEEGFRMAHDPLVSDVVIGGSWIGFLHRGDYYINSGGAEIAVDPNTAAGNVVFDAFEAEIKSLTVAGKAVWLILTPPGDPKADPTYLSNAQSAQDFYITVAEHRSRVASINRRLREIARRAGAISLDPEDWLCRGGICSFVDDRRIPIYKDATHLRASYVRDKMTMLDRLIGIE